MARFSNHLHTSYPDVTKATRSLAEQIQSEQDFIASVKTPGSLLRSLLSPSVVRGSQLYQITQARSKIAQLQLQLFQAETERDELEELRAQFPDHDRLIEQAAKVSFQTWSVEIKEEELDVYERKLLLQERLDAKRLQEEEQRIFEELIELDRKQEEIDRQQEELAEKKAELSQKGENVQNK